MSELDDFKVKVRETTKRYAIEHELCEVVDDYLGELGLEPVCAKRDVVVRLAIQADIKVQVDDGWWQEASDEEKQERIKQNLYLNETRNNIYSHDGAEVALPTSQVRLELAGALFDPPREGPPLGWEALYASYEGTVKHYYPETRERGAYVNALCQSNYAYTYSPRTTSDRARGEVRICRRCAAKAEAL